MRTRTMLATVALSAAGVATTVTPASATEGAALPGATTKIYSVSPVALVGAKVLVAGTYRCTGTYHHLWVSAKQGPGDLTQEGSSSIAKSWYDVTHDNFPAPQGGGSDNAVICDGKRHTGIFSLTAKKGHLHRGRAYVQFCLLTGNNPAPPPEQPESFASNMQYRKVLRLR